mmetsp:Transcript_10108/g.17281  ORF Transcript_10108/g.17281 Transcript_10108/m.17281 type:complete len:206 (+) Transcript_10108:507-1124(+)
MSMSTSAKRFHSSMASPRCPRSSLSVVGKRWIPCKGPTRMRCAKRWRASLASPTAGRAQAGVAHFDRWRVASVSLTRPRSRGLLWHAAGSFSRPRPRRSCLTWRAVSETVPMFHSATSPTRTLHINTHQSELSPWDGVSRVGSVTTAARSERTGREARKRPRVRGARGERAASGRSGDSESEREPRVSRRQGREYRSRHHDQRAQ